MQSTKNFYIQEAEPQPYTDSVIGCVWIKPSTSEIAIVKEDGTKQILTPGGGGTPAVFKTGQPVSDVGIASTFAIFKFKWAEGNWDGIKRSFRTYIPNTIGNGRVKIKTTISSAAADFTLDVTNSDFNSGARPTSYYSVYMPPPDKDRIIVEFNPGQAGLDQAMLNDNATIEVAVSVSMPRVASELLAISKEMLDSTWEVNGNTLSKRITFKGDAQPFDLVLYTNPPAEGAIPAYGSNPTGMFFSQIKTLLGKFELPAIDTTGLQNPPAGTGWLYAKNDGKLYFRDPAGTEYDLTAMPPFTATNVGEYLTVDNDGNLTWAHALAAVFKTGEMVSNLEVQTATITERIQLNSQPLVGNKHTYTLSGAVVFPAVIHVETAADAPGGYSGDFTITPTNIDYATGVDASFSHAYKLYMPNANTLVMEWDPGNVQYDGFWGDKMWLRVTEAGVARALTSKSYVDAKDVVSEAWVVKTNSLEKRLTRRNGTTWDIQMYVGVPSTGQIPFFNGSGMALSNVIAKNGNMLELWEQPATNYGGTPPATKGWLIPAQDGHIYYKNPAGQIFDLTLGSQPAVIGVPPSQRANLRAEQVADGDTLTLMFTSDELTIRGAGLVMQATGNASATIKLMSALTRNSATPTEHSTGTVQATEEGTYVATFADPIIPANSWVWIEVTDVQGSIAELAGSLEYYIHIE